MCIFYFSDPFRCMFLRVNVWSTVRSEVLWFLRMTLKGEMALDLVVGGIFLVNLNWRGLGWGCAGRKSSALNAIADILRYERCSIVTRDSCTSPRGVFHFNPWASRNRLSCWTVEQTLESFKALSLEILWKKCRVVQLHKVTSALWVSNN